MSQETLAATRLLALMLLDEADSVDLRLCKSSILTLVLSILNLPQVDGLECNGKAVAAAMRVEVWEALGQTKTRKYLHPKRIQTNRRTTGFVIDP